MRTTLPIDDDVLSAAEKKAAIGGNSVDEMISYLARCALMARRIEAKTRKWHALLKARKSAPHA
jgi:hypothetical protein